MKTSDWFSFMATRVRGRAGGGRRHMDVTISVPYSSQAVGPLNSAGSSTGKLPPRADANRP